MYIDEKDRKKLLPEIAKLDLISQQEMEQAVNSYARVALRIEHVAKIVANIEEALRGVEKYEWRVKDWRIDLKDYLRDKTHLNDMTVTVDLVARRREELDEYERGLHEYERGLQDRLIYRPDYYDDPDYISRRVEFPRRYLLSDDWIEEVKAKAAAKRIYWLERDIEKFPQTIKNANDEVIKFERKFKAAKEELAALKVKGYKSYEELRAEEEATENV